MKNTLENLVKEGLKSLRVEAGEVTIEHPDNLQFGDYFTNAAIKYGHKEELFKYLDENKPAEVERVEMAGPGFINFYLSKEFFHRSLGEIIKRGDKFGHGEHAKGYKVMVEHTDPNPFKDLHIGHLVPLSVGTSLANVFAANGAEVKQTNYQGDVGLHVAKAVWAIKQGQVEKPYAYGNKKYEEDEKAKIEIVEINKRIYEHSSEEINKIYEEGKKESLEEFQKIFERLGVKFDFNIFESETGPIGKQIVEENIGKVFKESDGAIVYEGSHTRVFINSQGLPTYESKDLGNAKLKYEKFPYDMSVVVTGNEIRDYFVVVLEAMGKVLPELAQKTKHIPHGMLRLPTGKMSSRTGDVITAEELIEEVKGKTQGREDVAIGAIKYMILRQSIGSDIIFDIEKSVSTEGDSGVYLQYTHARAGSLMEKAGKKGEASMDAEVADIEKLLYRLPEMVERAGRDYAPNIITTYLTELAASFNNFYAHNPVMGSEKESHLLAIVEAFKTVMKNGLNVLGIPSPERI